MGADLMTGGAAPGRQFPVGIAQSFHRRGLDDSGKVVIENVSMYIPTRRRLRALHDPTEGGAVVTHRLEAAVRRHPEEQEARDRGRLLRNSRAHGLKI